MRKTNRLLPDVLTFHAFQLSEGAVSHDMIMWLMGQAAAAFQTLTSQSLATSV